MPTSSSVLLVALLSLPFLLPADELPTPLALDALARDEAALQAQAEVLATRCAEDRVPAACYASAWAQHRLASAAFAREEPKAAGAALVACASTATPLTADSHWGAEARALLAGCYGMSIALNPMKGVRLGPQTAQLTAAALAAAPRSPRAHLFAAQRYANTPAMWGGDPRKAREHLARGLELLAEVAASDAWGRHDLERLREQLERRSAR